MDASMEGGGLTMSRRLFRPALIALAILAMMALGAPRALAVPPSNDDFDSATLIGSVPFSDSLDTTEATTAADDPDCAGNGHTVWYSFTPTSDMGISANTFGSDYDTTLSVYTGSRGALEQVACNDDTQSLQSSVRFAATGGVTYFFMAGSFDNSSGGNLQFSVQEVLPPPNDDFDNATVVTDLPFSDTEDTTLATTAADDPDCFGNSNTVWYSFTAPASAEFEANTFDSDYETTLSVYSGSRGALDQIACSNFRVRFQATAGTTYFFMVGSAFGDGGTLTFALRQLPPRLQLAVTIDPTGSVSRSGVALIHGTLSCSREASIDLFGSLRERVGKRTTLGYFRQTIDCNGVTPWSATVVGETGSYKAGGAQATAAATFFDEVREETVQASASRTVQLQR
jgi:hypothetical protein